MQAGIAVVSGVLGLCAAWQMKDWARTAFGVGALS